MSRFTALLLAGIMVCPAFYNLGILGYWVTNRNYISANLCDNRARPQLHCNGKCYLKKKMADSAPVSAPVAPGLKKGLELAECPLPVPGIPALRPVVKSESGMPGIYGQDAAGFPAAVFHPPALRA